MAILGTSNADVLVGTSGNDTILAGAGDDTVLAGAGNDIVSGGAGNDKIAGGAGDDTLAGGVGNDVIQGGDGNDIIIGGADADIMGGGDGADKFIFVSALDSGVGVGLRDVILDFEVGVDKIGLAALNLTAANIDLSQFFGGTTAAGAYAQLLRIDTDGDGSYDFEIQLNATGGTVTLADLIL